MKLDLLKKFYSEMLLLVRSASSNWAQVKHLLTLKINVVCLLYNYMVQVAGMLSV